MATAIDVTGKVFGGLTVVRRAARPEGKSQGGAWWECLCVCGAIRVINGTPLRSGRSKSCGCQKSRFIAAFMTRHGNSARGAHTPESWAWSAMKRRCYDPRCDSYKYYGGRGITVCDRWRGSFENFLEDMGRRPSPHHSMERINNDGNYEPSNCKWATASEQVKNRRNLRGAAQTGGAR